MTRAISSLAALLLTIPASPAGDVASDSAASATARSDGGLEWVETSVDGTIRDVAVAHEGDRRRLLLLVGERTPEAAEKEEGNGGEPAKMPPCPGAGASLPRLVEGAFDAGDRATVLRRDLPAESRSLEVVDLDGDGVDEWLLVLPGSIRLLSPTGPAADRELIASAALGAPRLLRAPRPGRWLANPGPRALDLYRPRDGRLEPLAATSPGRTAFVWGDTLGVVWRPLAFVDERQGVLRFASRATNTSTGRAAVERVHVAADGGVEETTCWLKLPQPEDLLESFPLTVLGETRLLITTKEAGKLGLTAEKRLRLYPLEEDRTRLGVPPLWQTSSRMNLWQGATVELIDADGRPPLDLAIGYWKGLSDDKVVVDVYSGKPDGTFAGTPETTAFNVKKASRSFLGIDRDLDGDGRIDLWVVTERGTQFHRGRPAGAKTLVETRGETLPFTPSVAGFEMVVSLGSSGMSAQPVNDPARTVSRVALADGRTALLLVRRGENGANDATAAVRLEPR